MRGLDWDDLRYLLALARAGSFAAAGRVLGVDPTTMARRLKAMEGALAVRLFDRDALGNLSPTAVGSIAIERASVVEGNVGALSAAVTSAAEDEGGIVRVTAVPILANRVLLPAAHELRVATTLRLELIADHRGLSLPRCETDIAIRLARPDNDVGPHVLAKRIGYLEYGLYAARQLDVSPEQVPWLMYSENMQHLPQARWLTETIRPSDPLAQLAVNDADSLLEAVIAGYGKSLLPTLVADRVASLRRLHLDAPPPMREIWVLTHADLRRTARVERTVDWIERIFVASK